MKYFISLLVLLVVILHYTHNSTTSTSSSTRYPHTQIKVLDWDTFVLNNEHIRLASINAPEIFHWDKPAQCWAYQSMARLEYYLTRIRPVSYLHITRLGTDKYGRTLATVQLEWDWLSINERMVQEWFAEAFIPEGWVPAPDYKKQNSDAINNLLGNYSHCVYRY